jgi:hypothetical protein
MSLNNDWPALSQAVAGQTRRSTRRGIACEDCRRKKSRCDMRRPECSLCARTWVACIYPAQRNKPRSGGSVGSKVNVQISEILQLTPGAIAPDVYNEAFSEPTDSTAFGTLDELQTAAHDARSQESASGPEITLPDAWLSNLYPDLTSSLLSWSTPATHEWLNPSHTTDWTEPNESYLTSSGFQIDPEGVERAAIHPPESQNADSIHSGKFEPIPAGPEGTCSYRLDVLPSEADELIEIFFEKIQCFLPLLHRPRFYETYVASTDNLGQRYINLAPESVLLLNTMFALSSRFSTATTFVGQPQSERGNRFIQRAMLVYEEVWRDIENGASSLRHLQGLLLLAYNILLTGPSAQGWAISGQCFRLAFDLDLQDTDMDLVRGDVDQSSTHFEEWINREERRRAWWICWDLDGLVSSMSLRPFNLDRHCMHVLLPVCDEAWYSGTITVSAPIASSASLAWKSLQGCPNQNERAWFLLVTYLFRLTCEAASSPTSSSQSINTIDTAVACLLLALPESFDLGTGRILFDESHFKESNWIMCTHILLQW